MIQVEVKRLDQKLTDNRTLVAHERVRAGFGGGGAGLMGGKEKCKKFAKACKATTPANNAETMCEQIALEMEKATSQWMETSGGCYCGSW